MLKGNKSDYDERMKRYLRYLETTTVSEEVIETCVGEVRIIIEALADYADIVTEEIQNMSNSYGKAAWEIRLQKIKTIQKKFENSIGYDRDKQLENCRQKKEKKQEDIGSDALEMTIWKDNKKK